MPKLIHKFSNCCGVPVRNIENNGRLAECTKCGEHCEIVTEYQSPEEFYDERYINFTPDIELAGIENAKFVVIDFSKDQAGKCIRTMYYSEGSDREQEIAIPYIALIAWGQGKHWHLVTTKHSTDEINEEVYEDLVSRQPLTQTEQYLTAPLVNERRKHQFINSLTTKILEQYLCESQLQTAE